MYFSKEKMVKRKQQDTRSSHQSQTSSQQSESQSFSQQNCSVQSFNNINADDGEIKFDNGWIYNGQHYSNQFHGWGRFIDPYNKQVYKGNFCNGYFHGYGKVNFNPMFEYLINTQTLKRWLRKSKVTNQRNKSNLNQIQVRTPFSKENKQIYTFQKYSSKGQKNRLSLSSSTKYEISEIQWLTYQGQFNEGNITGFGTLKINVFTKQSLVSIQSQHLEQQALQIVGKFFQGKILSGLIKK